MSINMHLGQKQDNLYCLLDEKPVLDLPKQMAILKITLTPNNNLARMQLGTITRSFRLQEEFHSKSVRLPLCRLQCPDSMQVTAHKLRE